MGVYLRLVLIFVLLALSTVVQSSSFSAEVENNATRVATSISDDDAGSRGGGTTCDVGSVLGDCVEPEEEGMMATEEEGEAATRRVLARRRRAISYGALGRNRVPCRRRGRSYYNCGGSGRANPYRRGCSAITRCGRYTG